MEVESEVEMEVAILGKDNYNKIVDDQIPIFDQLDKMSYLEVKAVAKKRTAESAVLRKSLHVGFDELIATDIENQKLEHDNKIKDDQITDLVTKLNKYESYDHNKVMEVTQSKHNQIISSSDTAIKCLNRIKKRFKENHDKYN